MDIPVFHDDQHGTAIVAAAGLINACHLTGRDLQGLQARGQRRRRGGHRLRRAAQGDGHARPDNVILCDTKGVVYQGRTEGMNQWKSAHAAKTDARTLTDALEGCDAFFGLSVKGALTQDMVRLMADKPIIFAMANPDPEITPEEAREASPHAIIATGRSDYPNQVNNVLGFPYIFRGALDVRASTINEAMKIAAAEALAQLAREDVPDEVSTAGARPPAAVRPGIHHPQRLRPAADLPPAAGRRPGGDARAASPAGRSPTCAATPASSRAGSTRPPTRSTPSWRACAPSPSASSSPRARRRRSSAPPSSFRNDGYGTPVLIGREDRVRATMARLGLGHAEGIDIHNARLSHNNRKYADFLYDRLQRRGFLWRDCQRMVNQDRNVFAACMVATGDADAMVTGLTRAPAVCLEDIAHAIEPTPGAIAFGLTLMVGERGQTIFIADTLMHERPNPQELADIACGAADAARRLGHEPRVALLSHSTFGNPMHATGDAMRDAVAILDARGVDFEYDGEMSPDVALDPGYRALYPFCRLTGPANVLVMPGLHSAHITSPPGAPAGRRQRHRPAADRPHPCRPARRRWTAPSARSSMWRPSRRTRRCGRSGGRGQRASSRGRRVRGAMAPRSRRHRARLPASCRCGARNGRDRRDIRPSARRGHASSLRRNGLSPHGRGRNTARG